MLGLWALVGMALAAAASYGSSSIAQFHESGTHSGIHKRETVVARNRDEWVRLWTRHMAGRVGGRPEPPPIDFERRMLVAVFAGDKPTGGYSVQFVAEDEQPDACVMRFELKYPPPGAILTQAITQPYAMVTIPKTEKPIRFEITEVRPDHWPLS